MNKAKMFVIGIALLITPQARAADKLENIKLVWKPTVTTAKLGGIQATGISKVKIQLLDLTDGRSDKQLIGENREKPNAPRKVTTQEDLPAFVTDKLKTLIGAAGLTLVDRGGDVILGGELQRFFVSETNSYDGEVRIKFVVKSPSSMDLWTGDISGHGSNFGRSYKDENYYETWSNAVIALAVELFKDSGFRRVLTAQ